METSARKIENPPVNGVNVDELFGTIDAVKKSPVIAKFRFRAQNRWIDGGHNRTTVKKWKGERWHAVGEGTFEVEGNCLELGIARDLVSEIGDPPAFDFHWADNIQGFAGVAELGVNGDSAPNRRWNYRFEVSPPTTEPND